MFHHPIIICKPIIVSSIWNVEIGCGLPYLNEHKVIFQMIHTMSDDNSPCIKESQ